MRLLLGQRKLVGPYVPSYPRQTLRYLSFRNFVSFRILFFIPFTHVILETVKLQSANVQLAMRMIG